MSIKIKNPDGEILEITTSIRRFCHEQGLGYENFLALLSRKCVQYRRWCHPEIELPPLKCYSLEHFDGRIETFHSFYSFAKKHGLFQGGVNNVINKRSDSAGGWFRVGEVKKHVLVNHEGEEFSFGNVAEFCREHSLSSRDVLDVLKGAVLYYLGWHIPSVEKQNERDYLKSIRIREALGNDQVYTLHHLDGRVESFSNIRQFEEKHALQRQVKNVLLGRKFACKDWYDAEKVEPYALRNSTGEIVRFFNVTKFAKENGLSSTNVRKVLSGVRNNVKGWKLVNGKLVKNDQ